MTSPVWHPFTQHGLQPDSIEIVRAEGAWLTTADGRRILDAIDDGLAIPEATVAHPLRRLASELAEAIEVIRDDEPLDPQALRHDHEHVPRAGRRLCIVVPRDRATRNDAPVGPHLADQLVLLLALAGEGTFRTTSPTMHTQTQLEVIGRFLGPVVSCAEDGGGTWRISAGRKGGV